ncbi:hypothetical protein Hanom_Chr10g00877801 [Helianthus anomalus]
MYICHNTKHYFPWSIILFQSDNFLLNKKIIIFKTHIQTPSAKKFNVVPQMKNFEFSL